MQREIGGSTGSNAVQRLTRLVVCASISIALFTACGAKEPNNVSVSGVVYNYSDVDLAWVKINGKVAGTGLKEVSSGDVSSGGTVCCIDIPVGSTEIEVELEPSRGPSRVVKASVEKWWPDLAHYGAIHILPGNKVVVEVLPSSPLPRKDLLEAQQHALGHEKKVNFKFWAAGPIQRTDGGK